MVGLSGTRTISAALISRVNTRSEGTPLAMVPTRSFPPGAISDGGVVCWVCPA
jgi:hypothetical protein